MEMDFEEVECRSYLGRYLSRYLLISRISRCIHKSHLRYL